MTCLDDGVCTRVRRDLTGEALAFWQKHEAELRELTLGELRAFAAERIHIDDGVLPQKIASRMSTIWREADLPGWRAWRNGTTAKLEGLARRRAATRALLLEAITRASGAILRVIGAVLRSRLGL